MRDVVLSEDLRTVKAKLHEPSHQVRVHSQGLRPSLALLLAPVKGPKNPSEMQSFLKRVL